MPLAVKPNQIKYLMLSAGLLGLILRSILFATGIDEKGLLIAGHWADSTVWVLTALVIGLIFLTMRNCTEPESDGAPTSVLCTIGSLVAACGFLLSPVPAAGNLALVEPVFRILAAAALTAVAFCRFRSKQPSYLLHSAACLYLALRMVCLYQLWSADPQLQYYAFYLGAHVALMLCCYQMAALDADSSNFQSLWSWGLGAIYLCLTAIPASQDAFFLICCAFWMFSTLTPAAIQEGD